MRKINRLFYDDFLSPSFLLNESFHKEEGSVHSQIDEEEDAWYIRLALPGLNNKSISLALEDGVLVVQYEKDDQQEKANEWDLLHRLPNVSSSIKKLILTR